jgi:hypothetical protein
VSFVSSEDKSVARLQNRTPPKMNNKHALGSMLMFFGLGLNISALIHKHYPGPDTYDFVVLSGSLLLFAAAILMRLGKNEK